MAVFLAASDETDQGHHRSMFWHAGFLAPTRDWDDYFAPAWQEDVLNSPPPIECVHVSQMKGHEWRTKYDFSESQVHDKLDAAGHVIDTMGSLHPIGVKANAGIFLDLFRNCKMRKSEGENAKRFLIDHLCFHSYSFVVLTYVAEMFPEAEKVDFLVDRKDGVFDKQKELYESLYSVLPALGRPDLLSLLGEILPGGMIAYRYRLPIGCAGILDAQKH